MKKVRLIPVLLLKNGWLVQSKKFSKYQNLGNPVDAVKRLSEWAVDELIYLDITKDSDYDLRRNDIKSNNHQSIFDIIEDVSKSCFMPITVGGKIRKLSDIENRLKKGADKITLNTMAHEDLSFVSSAAKEFGSQCIVVSIDSKKINKKNCVMKNGGKVATKYSSFEWSKIVESEGAGEILINSVDNDGKKNGYDIDLIDETCSAVRIPVIALGGVGEWEHFEKALFHTRVDAIAAANIFHYRDQSVYLAKKYLYERKHNVRKPNLIEIKKF